MMATQLGLATAPPPRLETNMFLGWYDPDKKVSEVSKVTEAIERYGEKFGSAPEVCLTSPADAAALERDGFTAIPVRAVSFISRHTYYVGVQ